MPEVSIGILERHFLPWSVLRTIGGSYKCVVSMVDLSGMIRFPRFRFCARLSTNWRNVSFDATFVTNSVSMWTSLTFGMGCFATSNALTLLLQSLQFVLGT